MVALWPNGKVGLLSIKVGTLGKAGHIDQSALCGHPNELVIF